MSNKLSLLFNSTSALLEFQIWSDGTSHAIPFKSCTTTSKNRFELVTASLNDVLPMRNGSTPRNPLKPPYFPTWWFISEKHVVEDDVLFTKRTRYISLSKDISTVSTYKLHWKNSICHAQTSLFDDCAGGSQGVQLLYGSNQGQVWAIGLRQVWVGWHPSIQSWSLWIAKSTCLCESTLPETEPADSIGTLQVHGLQALKTLFKSKWQ